MLQGNFIVKICTGAFAVHFTKNAIRLHFVADNHVPYASQKHQQQSRLLWRVSS